MPRQFYKEADGVKVFPKSGDTFTSDELAERFGAGFVPPSFKPEVPVAERPGKVAGLLGTLSDVATVPLPILGAIKGPALLAKAGAKFALANRVAKTKAGQIAATVLGGEAGLIGAKGIGLQAPTPMEFLVEGVASGAGELGAMGFKQLFYTERAGQQVRGALARALPKFKVTKDEAARVREFSKEAFGGRPLEGVETVNGFLIKHHVPRHMANIGNKTREVYKQVRVSGKNLLPRRMPTGFVQSAETALKAIEQSATKLDGETISGLTTVLRKIVKRGSPVPRMHKIKGKEVPVRDQLTGIIQTDPAAPISFDEYMDITSEFREFLPSYNMRLFNTTKRSEGILNNLFAEIQLEQKAMAKGKPTELLLNRANIRFQDEFLPQRESLEVLIANPTGSGSPSQMIETLIGSNNASHIQHVYDAVGPNDINGIRTGWLSSRIARFVDARSGVFNARGMFDEFEALTPAVRRQILGDDKNLLEILTRLDDATGAQRIMPRLRGPGLSPSGTGGTGGSGEAAAGMLTATAIGATGFFIVSSLAKGHIDYNALAVGAGATFFLPRHLAKPGTRRLLNGLMKAGDGTERAIRLGGQLITQAGLRPFADPSAQHGLGMIADSVARGNFPPGMSSALQN